MISQDQIYGITAVILFCLGLSGVLSRPEVLRKIIAINLMGAAVFLMLVAIAWKNTDGIVDPVPHAMAASICLRRPRFRIGEPSVGR